MRRVSQVAAILAAGMLLAQPCAANDFRDGQTGLRQPSAFAGVNIRLPLGQNRKAKPTARLQFTVARTLRDERTGAVETFKAQGLEIGGSEGGKPAFYLNGQRTSEMEEKLDIGGTETTLLIVGGVLLVVVIVAAAAASAQADLLNPCSGDSTLCD